MSARVHTRVYVFCARAQHKPGSYRQRTHRNTYKKNKQTKKTHGKEDCAAGDKTVGWYFQQRSGKQGWQSQEKELQRKGQLSARGPQRLCWSDVETLPQILPHETSQSIPAMLLVAESHQAETISAPQWFQGIRKASASALMLYLVTRWSLGPRLYCNSSRTK